VFEGFSYSLSETVWKIVRVTSGAYFSPTRSGKTGVFALLVDSWRCQYGRRSEFPNSFSSSTLAIRERKGKRYAPHPAAQEVLISRCLPLPTRVIRFL
jgi:hypothetical protein